jgi:hypothetical protein
MTKKRVSIRPDGLLYGQKSQVIDSHCIKHPKSCDECIHKNLCAIKSCRFYKGVKVEN